MAPSVTRASGATPSSSTRDAWVETEQDGQKGLDTTGAIEFKSRKLISSLYELSQSLLQTFQALKGGNPWVQKKRTV